MGFPIDESIPPFQAPPDVPSQEEVSARSDIRKNLGLVFDAGTGRSQYVGASARYLPTSNTGLISPSINTAPEGPESFLMLAGILFDEFLAANPAPDDVMERLVIHHPESLAEGIYDHVLRHVDHRSHPQVSRHAVRNHMALLTEDADESERAQKLRAAYLCQVVMSLVYMKVFGYEMVECAALRPGRGDAIFAVSRSGSYIRAYRKEGLLYRKYDRIALRDMETSTDLVRRFSGTSRLEAGYEVGQAGSLDGTGRYVWSSSVLLLGFKEGARMSEAPHGMVDRREEDYFTGMTDGMTQYFSRRP